MKAHHRAPLFLVALFFSCTTQPEVMTVNGLVAASELGFTLPHEHVLVDFIGADSITPGRYDRDSAFNIILPHLLDFKSAGGNTLFECTPLFIGRDVELLKRLSVASGLNIITNTGNYGAAKEKYYPDYLFAESAQALAVRWINEWESGIDGTEVKPGFMKLGADKGPLTPAQEKTVHAAAITHLRTGLTIAMHTGDGAAARQELEIIESHGILPEAFVWIHAQNERDSTIHRELAKKGAWVEFDGLTESNFNDYVRYLQYAKWEGFLERVMVSHDAGWYNVGSRHGGQYRGYRTLKLRLLPRLQEEGFTEAEIRQLTVENPGKAFSVRIRQRR